MMKLMIVVLCGVLSVGAYADGRYISKFVTQDSSREHGGAEDVYLLGSYVVWQGEDSSGDDQVYLFKGSGSNVEIVAPGGSSFSRAFLEHAHGNYITLRGYRSGSWGYYLHDIAAGVTIAPSYFGSYFKNHTVSGSNVFYSAYDGAGTGRHHFYKYDIASDSHEEISIEGADYAISESYNRDHYEGQVVWRGELSTNKYYYYDGSSTTVITNGSITGLGLSSNNIAFSDGSSVAVYDISAGTWSSVAVEDELLLGAIPGWTNSYVSHGYDNVIADEGYVLEATISYSDHDDDHPALAGLPASSTTSGRYKATPGQPSSDKQIYFLEGFTNLILISDYRYDGDGVVKFDSPWFDTLETYFTNITEESYISYTEMNHFTDGVGNLPERWVSHDLTPSVGNGIIAYHAYGTYSRYSPYAHVDELMVFDLEEEKHYGLFLDDSARLGYYGAMQWAACDPETRNVAFTLVDPWSSVDMDVGVSYWVGPEACLIDVDLSGEDLSDLDFSNADLTHADFSGADFSGTDFSDAVITGAIFSNATYDTSTVMPMSFSPSDHAMISLIPDPLSTYITSIDAAGISFSNSVSNLYVGVKYTASLTSSWHDAEVEGMILLATNSVGSFSLPIDEFEAPHLFFRLVASTNLIGDYVDYTNSIPQFVAHDYISLDDISSITRFRSGQGHDYSDDFETCRSMKHYYTPSVSNWSDVAVYSPIDGTILDVEHEWAGTRVMIKSTDHPAYHFVLFHIDLDTTLTNGAAVSAGQLLGSHIGNETTSDIAVRISTVYSNQPMHRLISYFEVMTDGLFSNYVDRGVADLSDLIISQSERDSDPLICEGETFIGPTGSVYYVDGGFGNITNVFELSAP